MLCLRQETKRKSTQLKLISDKKVVVGRKMRTFAPY